MNRIGYGNNIVEDGLVFYLDTSNPQSYDGNSTYWKDISGNNYIGTLTNSPTYNNSNKGYFTFDGINETTNFGNILNIGLNDWTISCWFKINSYTSGIQGIFGKTSYRSYVGRYTFHIENGFLKFFFQPTNYSLYGVSTYVTPYKDNKWHNFIVTMDRDGFLIMYIDSIEIGKVDISSSKNINLTSSTDSLFVGSYASTTGQVPQYFFNGNISLALIYKKSLTPQEVLQNYNTTKNRYIENRQFVIFSTTEVDKINFSEVLETSIDTLRKSIDETKTFVKWEGNEPSFINELTTIEGKYTYEEMLVILSTDEWIINEIIE